MEDYKEEKVWNSSHGFAAMFANCQNLEGLTATQTQEIESQQLLNLQVNRLSIGVLDFQLVQIERVGKLKKRMLRPVQKVE